MKISNYSVRQWKVNEYASLEFLELYGSLRTVQEIIRLINIHIKVISCNFLHNKLNNMFNLRWKKNLHEETSNNRWMSSTLASNYLFPQTLFIIWKAFLLHIYNEENLKIDSNSTVS